MEKCLGKYDFSKLSRRVNQNDINKVSAEYFIDTFMKKYCRVDKTCHHEHNIFTNPNTTRSHKITLVYAERALILNMSSTISLCTELWLPRQCCKSGLGGGQGIEALGVLV